MTPDEIRLKAKQMVEMVKASQVNTVLHIKYNFLYCIRMIGRIFNPVGVVVVHCVASIDGHGYFKK